MDYSHNFLENLPTHPGIYKMISTLGRVLYVGKARNLKDRVSSYFRPPNQLDNKTRVLMQQVHHVDITITPTENAALVLESTLIKALRPRYNILLKDDKSYPYLFLSRDDPFPRLQTHRGTQREAGDYFGPYPSAHSVYETLDLLQKIFKLRQCSNIFFKNRTRPCLQYQIKRCTAPCVGYIDEKSYQEDVRYVKLFLQGKNDSVIDALAAHMEKASNDLAFEEAGRYRDQIAHLRKIQQQQFVNARVNDWDMVALVSRAGVICVEVLCIRSGVWIGSQTFNIPSPGAVLRGERVRVRELKLASVSNSEKPFDNAPSLALPPHENHSGGEDVNEALFEFLPQYYLNPARGKSLPKRIYINHEISDATWIANTLSEQWGHKVTILQPKRAESKKWMQVALLNAQQALDAHLSSQMLYSSALEELKNALHLTELPKRFECFDISHTQGEATVASCVVFDDKGAVKSDYRRFNIKNVTAGDDYGAMRQALTRHYTNLKEKGAVPSVLIIDGGKGQLAVAEEVLKELQITNICLMGIAKGPTRKAGFETIFVSGQPQPLSLAPNSPALHLLQRIRDEAHRFAITGHRKQRAKVRSTSRLEDVPGIGPKRRSKLLRHFGGWQGIAGASVEEICKVSGMSIDLGQRLYDALHEK